MLSNQHAQRAHQVVIGLRFEGDGGVGGVEGDEHRLSEYPELADEDARRRSLLTKKGGALDSAHQSMTASPE